jgi:hypothetical protein
LSIVGVAEVENRTVYSLAALPLEELSVLLKTVKRDWVDSRDFGYVGVLENNLVAFLDKNVRASRFV